MVYSGFSGKVLSVETHINTAVLHGLNGITSSTLEVKIAKVTLTNGRIKEFDPDKIEMQADGDVEFVTTSDGKSIYLKNLTTGVSNVAERLYTKSEAAPFVGMACIAIIVYGGYSIFLDKSLMTGLSYVVARSIVLAMVIKVCTFLQIRFESDFYNKVRATGIKVAKFKAVQEEDLISKAR